MGRVFSSFLKQTGTLLFWQDLVHHSPDMKRQMKTVQIVMLVVQEQLADNQKSMKQAL